MKIRLVLFIFLSLFFMKIQAQADLLNVKFKPGGEAVDNSSGSFTIANGPVIPKTLYDSEIKQYISTFSPSGSQTSAFYKIDYSTNTAFKDQLQKSFSVELYLKVASNANMAPFASTEVAGFGVAQAANGGDLNFVFAKGPTYDYLRIGGKSIYSGSSNVYYHVVYTYEDGIVKSYFNGTLVSSMSVGNKLYLTDTKYQRIIVGGDVGTNVNLADLPFNGNIAAFKMYKKALSSSDISSLYAETLNRKNIEEINLLNNIISDLLPSYINSEANATKKAQAVAYLNEGWGIMHMENITRQIVVTYISKVQDMLGNYIVPADLLDVKFMNNDNAKDISQKNFTLEKGSVAPYNSYDPTIKQYVSSFSSYHTPSSNRYYKINYQNNTDFKEKLQKSFSMELYVKSRSHGFMAPVASTQGTGFGISQAENGGNLNFLFADGSGYKTIGGKSIYSSSSHQYNHIIYTYDHTTKTLKSYYNGTLTESKTMNNNLYLPAYNDQFLFIGGDVAGDKTLAEFPFHGDVATVRMYSRSLNSLEVNSLYQQIISRKELVNSDNLNEIIANKLPQYIEKQPDLGQQAQAKEYLAEGWNLMNSLNTTKEQIDTYLNKVKTNLGLDSTPESENKLPRFAVISDLHIGYTDENKIKNTFKILNEQKPALDAVFIVGDLTDGGSSAQNKRAAELLTTLSPSIQVYTLMGNHDNLFGSGINTFKPYFGNADNAISIKGYPFITLSDDGFNDGKNNLTSISGEHYNHASLKFLTEKLDEASKNYPGKPIFVYTHIPSLNTVLGSHNEFGYYFYSQKLRETLNNYEQAVVFSGHLHTLIGDERSIYQENFTSVNDGGISYAIRPPLLDSNGKFSISFNDNTPGTNRPPLSDKVAEGLIVQVERNGDVNIKRWDFQRNVEIKTPWVLKAPHRKDNFVYTKNRTGGKAPYFESGSKILFSNMSATKCTISFPQAKDDDQVDRYNIKVLDENGNPLKDKEYNISSRSYLNTEMPLELSWDIPTELYKEYQIRITAFDSFGNESEALVSEPFITNVGPYSAIKEIYLYGIEVGLDIKDYWAEPVIMKEVAGSPNVYTWTGFLGISPYDLIGGFKFSFIKSPWDYTVIPKGDTQIKRNGEPMPAVFAGKNYIFFELRNYALTYTVTFDLNTKTVTVKENLADAPLYLIGDAPGNWDINNAEQLTQVGNGLYTWTGNLKKGRFKFITKRGTWNSVLPSRIGQESVVLGQKHSVSNYFQGDYTFVLPEEGNYTISVNLKERYMIVSKTQNLLKTLTDTRNTPVVVANENLIQVKTNGQKIDQAVLFDISGNTLDTKTNQTEDFILGRNCSSGVYIVNLMYEGNILKQKILIQ